MTTNHTIEIDGLNLFYREAGQGHLPTLVLLHGFPTSSHMFLGLDSSFGRQVPCHRPGLSWLWLQRCTFAHRFSYTFDHLAEVTEKLLAQLEIKNFALYLQDYGGPSGFAWRPGIRRTSLASLSRTPTPIWKAFLRR